MKKILATVLSIAIFLSMGSMLVYANGGNSGNTTTSNQGDTTTSNQGDTTTSNPVNVGITLDNPFNTEDSLVDLLDNIFDNIIFPIGGILAVLAFIYAGFLFVTAQGNETKLGTAKTALLYTVIGTAVLLGARVISLVISNTIEQLK